MASREANGEQRPLTRQERRHLRDLAERRRMGKSGAGLRTVYRAALMKRAVHAKKGQ